MHVRLNGQDAAERCALRPIWFAAARWLHCAHIVRSSFRCAPLFLSCLRATSLSVGSTSVGAGASGKSTLFKQMINIYGKGFPEASVNELDTGSGRVCSCCLRHFLWLTLYLGCCCLSCDIHSERKTYTNIIYNKSVTRIAKRCSDDAGWMAASCLDAPVPLATTSMLMRLPRSLCCLSDFVSLLSFAAC